MAGDAPRSSRSNQNQPLPNADGDRLGTAPGVELHEDGGDVELDGVLRDTEPRGDDFVAEPLGDHAEYLDLARREGLTGDHSVGMIAEGLGDRKSTRLNSSH